MQLNKLQIFMGQQICEHIFVLRNRIIRAVKTVFSCINCHKPPLPVTCSHKRGTKRSLTEQELPLEPGDDIIDVCVVKSTRKQYDTSVSRLACLLQNEHPSSVQHTSTGIDAILCICA
jgi:hypothetical protein